MVRGSRVAAVQVGAVSALEDLGRRIERVALDPARIEQQLVFRVARPLLAIAGWRAKIRYKALAALFTGLQEASRSRAAEATRARAAHDAAVVELEANVTAVERAAIVRGRPPVGHAAWARRAWEILVAADRAIASLEAGAPDANALRQAARTDVAHVLPPLTLRNDASEPAPFTVDVPTRDAAPIADVDARLVELELAAIDHLLAAARSERSMLGRRRRLLLAARQRLLDVSAALPLEREGTRTRASVIAREIVRIDRLETSGLSVDVGLAHQARQSIDRGDPRRLYAALAAIDLAALACGDAPVARVTGQAIAKLWAGADPTSREAVDASLRTSASELLGAEVVAIATETIAAVHAAARERRAAATNDVETLEASTAVAYFAGADVALLLSTVGVDGCFEVGGALTPVRIVEEDRYIEQVRHPTPELVLVPARDGDDLREAIIGDPRTVLLDLATSRLLARRYVREQVRRRTRIVARSEVRIYLLDGSGSMHGVRARVRDGLLVAELATLIARLKAPGQVRCTLFYRYFTDELGPVTRVDSVASAKAAVRDVVGTMREGGTNIHSALLASLEQVEVARELDPDLSRAQIVLLTDGESPVDEDALVAARGRLGGLPIGISVIALGQENAALRGLVTRQRARGEPAFYHFLDDAQLDDVASGMLANETALHLPHAVARNPLTVARELESELGPLVEELRSIERERDIAALERLDAESRARREGTAASAEQPLASSEGERARSEAIHRNRASLAVRYGRWFPAQPPDAAPPDAAMPPKGTKERDEVDAAIGAISSVAEVVMLVGGPELARRAEAIELLERLLPDAQITPARYREILREWEGAVRPALLSLHAAASPV